MNPSNSNLEKLITQVEALSWNDLNLEPEPEVAKNFSELALVGKLVSMKALNRQTFHATIRASWSFVPHLSIEDVGENTFLFTFASHQEKHRVLDNRPWNFKGFHMVLRQWPPGLSIHDIPLHMSIFWIQVHGLPLEMLTKPNAAKIGQVLGNLLEVDFASIFGVTIRRYLRIKVEININNPLSEGFELLCPNGISHRIYFKYERLSEFCYTCGKLGHIQQACPTYVKHNTGSLYGPWMRAPSANNRRGNPFDLPRNAYELPPHASITCEQMMRVTNPTSMHEKRVCDEPLPITRTLKDIAY
ncbi:hypothetical protein F2P56_004306 [Juglans regia]|uniref:Uncharacterized protein LOC109004818 n=2 Tax=Juglans regia TaxID=51240 RepID=A0A2I4G585_JUGRE|nr:uncharacterized protein LOC109004818 [Juglans regia]KAF5477689.1 hypothetical protein F2P56_004306 [Juglans regia]